MLALIAWAGLAMQFAAVLPRSASLIEAVWAMLRYFTITTNLLFAVVMSGIAFGSAAFAKPFLLGGVTLSMAFVGAVYVTVLRARLDLSGDDVLADLVLHYVTPVASPAFWLLLRTGALRHRDPFLWSIYPLAYGAYAIARGASDGLYPYPFLDVAQFGAGQVAANLALLWFSFLVAGAMLVWLDRRITQPPAHH
jgi:hypothetical protein